MNGNEMWVSFSEDFSTQLGDNIPIVSVTPNCPSVVLCVSEKTEKGFKVIGVSGNGDFSFDWIAMAKVEIIVPDSEGMEQIKDVFYRKSFDVPQGNYKVLDISVKKQ